MHWGLFALTALAMALLHAGANLANDYYDHLSRNDELNITFAHPFTGGSRMIQDGLLPARAVLIASLVCMSAATVVGLYLIWQRGPVILALGLIGLLTGFFYTARPLQLGYRGLGEICIFLDFGLLPVLGAYYVQAGHFSWSAVWASLPVALLITAVLWINQFQDLAADRAVNKRHWVVRLGLGRAALIYAGLIVAVYASITLGVVIGGLTPWALIALGTLPLAVKAVRLGLARHADPVALTPANATTIGLHLTVGLLMSVGLVLGRAL